jgi:alkanesulfonate monooxygenase
MAALLYFAKRLRTMVWPTLVRANHDRRVRRKDMALRFHWMLPKGGEVTESSPQTPREAARYRIQSTRDSSPAPRPDMEGWEYFTSRAEAAGIDSILISFSRYEPDPLIVSCALGRATRKLKFIAAYRTGLIEPTIFIQQVNTLSALIDGRLSLNIVAGSSKEEQRGYGDFLAHDERYARAEEFLAVCHSFWRDRDEVNFNGKYYRVEKGKLHTPFVAPDRSVPEIYVSGHSEASARLACSQGSSWLRVLDTPDNLQPVVARARGCGIAVCLRMCLVCRPTRAEAIRVVKDLLPDDETESTVKLKDDSQMYREAKAVASDACWLSDSIWTGFVPHYGPVWTTLLGSPQDLAQALMTYKQIGITEFIISGWPEIGEMENFGREVLPLVREAERRAETAHV